MTRASVELSGTEEHSLEVDGRLQPSAARALTPAGLEPELGDKGALVNVLFFSMRQLGLCRPLRMGPRLDYGEALFRLGVRWRGALAWLAIACDLDQGVVRALGAATVRYPVRDATLSVSERAASTALKDHGRLSLEIGEEPLDSPAATPARPMLVVSRGQLYRIPWREDPAPTRYQAHVRVAEDSLGARTFGGDVEWRETGLVHRGRIHHCGVASRVRA